MWLVLLPSGQDALASVHPYVRHNIDPIHPLSARLCRFCFWSSPQPRPCAHQRLLLGRHPARDDGGARLRELQELVLVLCVQRKSKALAVDHQRKHGRRRVWRRSLLLAQRCYARQAGLELLHRQPHRHLQKAPNRAAQSRLQKVGLMKRETVVEARTNERANCPAPVIEINVLCS